MIGLVIATKNRHKVAEIQAILGTRFHCRTLDDFQTTPEIIEDAGTFAGNATKKAIAIAKWLSEARASEDELKDSETFVLADDSGLEVDALGGAPGVHSARFAAQDTGERGNSSTADNNAKLLRLPKGVPLGKRMARFRCVIALTPVLESRHQTASPVCSADEFELQTRIFEGTCEGEIQLLPAGAGGFGYDPLFVPSGYTQTFGELPEEVKNKLSHRYKALEKLRSQLGQMA